MRFLVRISWDVEAGNAIIRSGKLGQIIQSILAEQKPEAVYFTAEGGQRGGIMVVNISDVSQIPALAETLVLDRQCEGGIYPGDDAGGFGQGGTEHRCSGAAMCLILHRVFR